MPGITALKLHRLDVAEKHFGHLLDTIYISPAAGFLALLPVIADEGVATDVMELFRRLSARHPDVAEGYYAFGSAALRADNFAAGRAGRRDRGGEGAITGSRRKCCWRARASRTARKKKGSHIGARSGH